MNYQYNEQFAAASRQFADTAARISHLTLDNAQKALDLQLSPLQQNAGAAFSFFAEAADVRDFDGFKGLFPKGAQLARENAERSVGVSQEVFGATVKANQAIAELAKAQLEAAT